MKVFSSVNVSIENVKVSSFSTVNSGFPVAHQMALIKNCSFRTKERVGPTIGLAHVEHLKIIEIV